MRVRTMVVAGACALAALATPALANDCTSTVNYCANADKCNGQVNYCENADCSGTGVSYCRGSLAVHTS